MRRLIVAGAALVAGACSGTADPPTPILPQEQPAPLTALPRALTPAEQGVLNAANDFSFALWRQINQAQRDSSVFMSPLSASFALGMTMNGADGQTLAEMRSSLQFGKASLIDINAGYKSLIALLTSLDPSTTMEIANSIWYRNGFPFNQSFLSDGSTYFGATINPLDFSNSPASLSTINGWVNTQTKGKITKILDEIHPDDVMFLINAIYFKGSWRTKFDAALTQTAAFHAVGGDQSAPLMHRQAEMQYVATPTYHAVDLPYGDSAFTMTVVLPSAGTSVETVAASLDAATWQSLVAGLHTGLVDLSLPKMTMSWTRDLIPDLKGLGMRTPFVDGGADFTRMSARGRELSISAVKQKTYVSIDENGTEAAAVTSVGIHFTSAPLPVAMRVDRPFIFVIRERLSGTVLFMAKITRLPS